jgi:hypothetical protein
MVPQLLIHKHHSIWLIDVLRQGNAAQGSGAELGDAQRFVA